MKKKILIVENNMKLGGIQKALISLLKQIHDVYDVTLLLLYKAGPLLSEVPEDVRVIGTRSAFQYMGMAQMDCNKLTSKLVRTIYVLISKYISRNFAVKLASLTTKEETSEKYDIAISFSHMASDHSFFSGSAEYVLQTVKAEKKVCYIHCDYLNSGNRSKYSDDIYRKFDAIVCVSNSTRKKFIEALPDMASHTFSVYNPIDEKAVQLQAQQNPVIYDHRFLNLLSVARLTPEKGISRFIRILGKIDTRSIRYTIVGDGIERNDIERLIATNHLENVVTLCGEDDNPYRYMLNADLLVVPSYHEAAPVIFQEAKALCLPVLTTRTTSADEMIGTQFGIVVDNTDEDIQTCIITLIEGLEKQNQRSNI